MRTWSLFALLMLVLAVPAPANDPTLTERLDLSGRGHGDDVRWQFEVTGGRRASEQTTIPVPSHWELEGFGNYNYGHDEDKHDERGLYRHEFKVPERFRERHVELVFEGVMTDTLVRLNGNEFPVHRGGFYPFRFVVSDLLKMPPQTNVLEVEVAKVSSDKSIEAAERDADYWVFGGIYRPVYLEAFPAESMTHVALSAAQDGTLRAVVELTSLNGPARLRAQVQDKDEVVAQAFDQEVQPGLATVDLQGKVNGIEPWSAEHPRLYDVALELYRPSANNEEVLHRRIIRLGFRTVEVRAGQGLYVNGDKIFLQGVNRHVFWPSSGRVSRPEDDWRDARLIKSMNLNAVRTAHYPPDPSFLAACDEIGLYVLDELGGWQDAYSTEAGRPLVRAMVRANVNHPSIILWNNGNEGGHNPELDEFFYENDPWGRPVLHPDAPSSAGFDSEHYPTWNELNQRLGYQISFFKKVDQDLLVMPTEVLHGLYDGGIGAGLEDYWRLLQSSPRGAGAFLWAFTDEAVVRTDREGELDTDGNHAPDGIVGPRRELSGNYYAVREVFSPVRLLNDGPLGDFFNGSLNVENRFYQTNLDATTFRWSYETLPRPWQDYKTLASGEVSGPAAAPGETGQLLLPPNPETPNWEALRLEAFDSQGNSVQNWLLPRWGRRLAAHRFLPSAELEKLAQPPKVSLGKILLEGFLEPRAVPNGSLTVDWSRSASGWIRANVRYETKKARDFFGVVFPLDLDNVEQMEWFGQGPTRIWKNRRQGTLGHWTKSANSVTPPTAGHEPKLRGFYGNVYWLRLLTKNGPVVVLIESDSDVGLVPPLFPEDSEEALAKVPKVEGLGFFHGIPAIGTKFHPPGDLGPQSQRHNADGLYSATVWFYFGEPPL